MSVTGMIVNQARRHRSRELRIKPSDRSTEGRGHLALVTGASAGIGKSMVTLLAAKGYDVVLVARRVHILEELAGELQRTYGVAAHVLPADLGAVDGPALVRDELAARGLAVDFLVNNAGYAMMGNYLDRDWEDQLRLFRTLGFSYAELTRYLLGHMVEQKWGRIINVSSIAGLLSGTPAMVFYCATKIFVHRFTEGLAGEYRKDGVHATVSIPGSTDTELFTAAGLTDFSEVMPLFQAIMQSPMTVARQAYDASMRGKRVVVHGWPTKIWGNLAMHGPAPLRYKLTEWFARLPGAEGVGPTPAPAPPAGAPAAVPPAAPVAPRDCTLDQPEPRPSGGTTRV